jgi:hypothetical protein
MRIKGQGAPSADSPWNEIVPDLWMGGHFYQDANGRLPAIVGSEFDVVVSLYHRDGHGPAPHIEHHYAKIPDGPLTPAEMAKVSRLAAVTAAAVTAGRRVLVRCHFGYNRSGLVVAQALITMGHDTDDAISLIRRQRSEWALHNHLFVAYLGTGLTM